MANDERQIRVSRSRRLRRRSPVTSAMAVQVGSVQSVMLLGRGCMGEDRGRGEYYIQGGSTD